MMYKNWTVVITKVIEGKNGKTAYVDFTNKSKTESRVFKDLSSQRELASHAMRMIDSLEADITEATVLEVPVATPPTQAEVDKNLWFQALSRLEQLESIKTKNFLTGARATALDTEIAKVKKFLDDNVKPAYIAEV